MSGRDWMVLVQGVVVSVMIALWNLTYGAQIGEEETHVKFKRPYIH